MSGHGAHLRVCATAPSHECPTLIRQLARDSDTTASSLPLGLRNRDGHGAERGIQCMPLGLLAYMTFRLKGTSFMRRIASFTSIGDDTFPCVVLSQSEALTSWKASSRTPLTHCYSLTDSIPEGVLKYRRKRGRNAMAPNHAPAAALPQTRYKGRAIPRPKSFMRESLYCDPQ